MSASLIAGTFCDLYGLPLSVEMVERAEHQMAAVAMGGSDEPDWLASATLYAKHKNPWLFALEHEHNNDLYLDLSGFLTNAVLLGVPYRHEAFWLLLTTGRAWIYADGFREIGDDQRSEANVGSAVNPELNLSNMWRNVRWLAPLLANFKSSDESLSNAAFESWLTEHDAISAEQLLVEFRDDPRSGSAHALKTLWGLFALGEDEAMRSCAETLRSHAARIVRSAAAYALSDLARPGEVAGRLWRRRELFMEKTR